MRIEEVIKTNFFNPFILLGLEMLAKISPEYAFENSSLSLILGKKKPN